MSVLISVPPLFSLPSQLHSTAAVLLLSSSMMPPPPPLKLQANCTRGCVGGFQMAFVIVTACVLGALCFFLKRKQLGAGFNMSSSKHAQMSEAEMEVAQEHRKLKMMEHDKAKYTEETQNIIRKLRKAIDKKKEENEKLKEQLSFESTGLLKPSDSATQMVQAPPPTSMLLFVLNNDAPTGSNAATGLGGFVSEENRLGTPLG